MVTDPNCARVPVPARESFRISTNHHVWHLARQHQFFLRTVRLRAARQPDAKSLRGNKIRIENGEGRIGRIFIFPEIHSATPVLMIARSLSKAWRTAYLRTLPDNLARVRGWVEIRQPVRQVIKIHQAAVKIPAPHPPDQFSSAGCGSAASIE